MVAIYPRLIPFDHRFGTQSLIPNSSLILQSFPQKLLFSTVDETKPFLTIHFENLGPLKKFTHFLDLEKNCLRIEGMSTLGFFRTEVKVMPDEKELKLTILKVPVSIVAHYQYQDECSTLQLFPKATLVFPIKSEYIQKSEAKSIKMHFGCHKRQDWQNIERRLDIQEMIPFFFYLFQKVPRAIEFSKSNCEHTLIYELENAVNEKKREKIRETLLAVLQTAFHSLLVPHSADIYLQGYHVPPIPKTMHPLQSCAILHDLLLKMFIHEVDDQVCILPCLPVELHSGKIVQADIKNGTIFLEWSKKTVRYMEIDINDHCSKVFCFDKRIQHFRVREKAKKGSVERFQNNVRITFAPGRYIFDQFMK